MSLVDVDVSGDILTATLLETPEDAPYLKVGNSVDVLFKETEVSLAVTARELIELLGKTVDIPDVRDEFPAICSLGEQHGWDTELYRADYLLGEGVFQTEAVTETDACVAALSRRTKACKIYWPDTQATAALENDPIFDSEAGSWAQDALRAQLVALEILEGAE